MKLIDMHCDTISELYKKGRCESFMRNHWCVDIEKLQKAEEKAIPMVVCPFFCLTTKSILRLSYNIKLVKSRQIKMMHSKLYPLSRTFF